MGKGDKRRPSAVSQDVVQRNWRRTFSGHLDDEIVRCVNFLRQRGHGSEYWWGDDEEDGTFVQITDLETEKAPPAEAEGAESE